MMLPRKIGDDRTVRELQIDGVVLVVADMPGQSSTQLVAAAAARVLGLDAGEVIVSHRCATCGASDHGRPTVSVSGSVRQDHAPVSVSFSRTSGYEVAAARVGAAIGLDVESVARVAAHPVDGVLLHPAERRALEGLDPDAADRYRAQLWVAKEAELKRRGTGLRSDPGELMMLPIARPGLTLFDLDADVVGALATS